MNDDWIRTKSDEAAWDLGYRPDPKAADRVRLFFDRFLRQSKGEWAGKPFELLDWQWRDIVRPLFAWRRPDGTRRFRQAYVEIPKKNGKSTLCAGLGLYLLIGDGEPGAEVYSAAADRRQASIIYQEMLAMVEASPELSSYIATLPSKKRLDFRKTHSFFEALSADAKTKEGFNVSGLLFDELHTQPNRKLWDTLEYAGAARRQPLRICITTAGHDRESICWHEHTRAVRILKGEQVDPHFLAVVYAAGQEDDWRSEETWRKANPSYGVTIKPDEMRAACAEAQLDPQKENAFRRYRLNQWTEQEIRWLGVDLWDACETAPEFVGPAYGGLDLSATTDLTAFVLYFPKTHSLLPTFWVPASACKKRERLNKDRLDEWVSKKLIRATPGDVVDYDVVRKDINEICKRHMVKEIAVDRWNSVQLGEQLRKDGRKMFPFGQGFVSMSGPTKELERLVVSKTIRHGGNPVLRWNFKNLAVRQDDAGNLKPSKAKAADKIDGIVAAIMAIGRAQVNRETVYATRGMFD